MNQFEVKEASIKFVINTLKNYILIKKRKKSVGIADLIYCEINGFASIFYLALLETYLEPSQTSKLERLATIVNGWIPFTVFAKSSILDVWQGF